MAVPLAQIDLFVTTDETFGQSSAAPIALILMEQAARGKRGRAAPVKPCGFTCEACDIDPARGMTGRVAPC